MKREVPPVLIVIGIVILVLAVGAGGWYAINGGWKTSGQQDETYKHEILPIMAAKHGDTQALDEENKLRAAHGQPKLEMPKGKQGGSVDQHQKLLDLQRRLGQGQGN